MTLNNWIDRDKDICESATKGPWKAKPYCDDVTSGDGQSILDEDGTFADICNAGFVAASREGWPKALKALGIMLEHAYCNCNQDEPTHDPDCMMIIAAMIRGGSF